MRTIRVFPTITNKTAMDDLVRNGAPGLLDEADKILISVTFTWDLPKAEALEKQWRHVAPVEIGGPALGLPGGLFVPGKFVKQGCVVTSRGCDNKCWFCAVWKREKGKIKELKIYEGNDILDDNILACSDTHIKKVFTMLQQQKQISFTGGLEAKKLKECHIQELKKLSIQQLFFAYDTPDDLSPLKKAGKMFRDLGFSHNKLRSFILMGYPKDTQEKALKRCKQSYDAGFLPFGMLYRDSKGMYDPRWRRFQRLMTRPAITKKILKEI